MNRVLIRVIGAPLILAGLALCVYADYERKTRTAMTVLVGCFAAVSFLELCTMARLKGLKPATFLGVVAVLAPFAAILFLWSWADVATILALTTMVLLVRMVYWRPGFSPPDAAFTLLAVAYLSLLVYVFRFSGTPHQWLLWLLFLVATNKGSDMAAYVVGKSMGRHKLAPSISPNKTWEGSIGGLMAGTMLGGWALGHLAGGWGVGTWAAAAIVTVAAQMGDLVKSVIKRWAGVKDSGRFLPEFGGALDMVDSFILSAPAAVMTLSLLN